MTCNSNEKDILTPNGIRVLSLYDGMGCAMLALIEAGIQVSEYTAYEIDKYAVKTTEHNFPFVKHKGDVFKADYTDIGSIDILMGGSPCTFWSVCQKQNRETEASGMGWELFSQYVRALNEAKPKYFIYENNKSMSQAIRDSIDQTFGFEAICINSALVSGQHRQRLYWVGKRNTDGTYSKVDVDQPVDRGIVLQDVLDGVADRDKARTMLASIGRTTPREYSGVLENTLAAEPVNIVNDGKSFALKSTYYKSAIANFLNGGGHYPATGVVFTGTGSTTPVGKSQTIKAQYSKTSTVNICCYRSTYGASGVAERVESTPLDHIDTNNIAPTRIPEYGHPDKSRCITASYAYKGSGPGSLASEAFPDNPNKQVRDYIAEPIRVGTYPNNARNQKYDSQQYRIYDIAAKSVTLCGNGGGMGAKTGLYAIPVEFDGDVPTRAVSGADGKTYDVWQVKDGIVSIKDKQYPIKLEDGYYIIRKLTVSECKRLQTVPEWYEFPVSDTQAYKMLGNGWTVSVIAHLLKAINNTQQNGWSNE